MTDTKITTNTKRPLPEKKNVKDEICASEPRVMDVVESTNTSAELKKESGVVAAVTSSVDDSVKLVGGKASELADKLKKRLSHAFETGAKAVDELSQTGQEFADRYKTDSEMRKLKSKRSKLLNQLGRYGFSHHCSGGKFAESFFRRTEMIEQINQINSLDEMIVEIGKQPEKLKDEH